MATDTATQFELAPIDLIAAKRFVNEHHRHNETTHRQTWRFGVGLERAGELVGVAMAGRPTGRNVDQTRTIEIIRVCVPDDQPNACSRLYAAICRAAKALGYTTAITYTLERESGSSLRAAGFEIEATSPARPPGTRSRSRPRYEQTLLGPRRIPEGTKLRWRRDL